MSQNSRQRRDARRRAMSRGQRPPVTPPQPQRTTGQLTSPSQAEIWALIGQAARYASASPRAAVGRIEVLNQLGAVASAPHLDPAALLVDEVVAQLRQAWELGWQPLDLVHAARRRTSAGVGRWLARAALVEAAGSAAKLRAPQAWSDQLAVLASGRAYPTGPEALLPSRGRASVDAWTTALVALEFMHGLPPCERLVAPPSSWGQAGSEPRRSTPRRDHDPKMLTRIRALLAKAESTDHAAEAEAFTTKAQDLMARHAIDETLLADQSGQGFDVGGVRVLIDHPYAHEKAHLLHVVAHANRTRAVWHDYASYATIVGAPTDLAHVEMLFTSILVQATRAMTQAGELSHGADRSSAFRRAFLTAYAVGIGERLAASTTDAASSYGSDLVPVFERHGQAVTDEFERLFPNVTKGAARTSFDARGWHAGLKAADDAVLPAAAVEG